MADTKHTRHPRSNTGDGWRRLGFYHEPDHAHHVWRFVGSAAGLGELARALRECAGSEPTKESGVRLGPYEDLALNRWERTGIDYQGIYGPPGALRNLAGLIEEKLAAGAPGSSFDVGGEYASDAEYLLRFEIRSDDFDPTSVMPVPASEDDVSYADDNEDRYRLSPSVPCIYHDPNATITETEGLVHLDGDEIVFEFETKDAFFGAFRSGAQEVRLPLNAVSFIRFKRGVFGGKLSIQARDMISMADLTTAKPGLVILKFKRANRDLAAMLAEQLDEALAE